MLCNRCLEVLRRNSLVTVMNSDNQANVSANDGEGLVNIATLAAQLLDGNVQRVDLGFTDKDNEYRFQILLNLLMLMMFSNGGGFTLENLQAINQSLMKTNFTVNYEQFNGHISYCYHEPEKMMEELIKNQGNTDFRLSPFHPFNLMRGSDGKMTPLAPASYHELYRNQRHLPLVVARIGNVAISFKEIVSV